MMWICCAGILAVTVALLPVRDVRRLERIPAAGGGAATGQVPERPMSEAPD
ncbi:hypothetical protein [Streptomyces wuyuanensis]|uniref:hypothetical protein n=1 Tax=Streptomyces wuyuanensis TaxID=1196353 RepID=UPI003D75C0D4